MGEKNEISKTNTEKPRSYAYHITYIFINSVYTVILSMLLAVLAAGVWRFVNWLF